jgi:hypothetical protein
VAPLVTSLVGVAEYTSLVVPVELALNTPVAVMAVKTCDNVELAFLLTVKVFDAMS